MAAISLGELSSSVDPEIPEWGNPPGQYPVPLAEYIGQLEGTGGTETSKYPQEKRLFPE